MKVKDLHFYTKEVCDSDIFVFTYYENYRITILDRLTGFGDDIRDIETGVKDYSLIDKSNNFWLASGNVDIRDYPDLEVKKAIEKIKSLANSVIPEGVE